MKKEVFIRLWPKQEESATEQDGTKSYYKESFYIKINEATYYHCENFMSRPSVIPAFQSTPLHKQGQELRSEQTVIPLHEQHNLYLFFAP